MAGIKIHKAAKSYGGHTVLRGVTIDIEDGEFVVLVGPSGCGKSTLLRMIAGLEDITGGEIVIEGRVVNDVPAKERNIAMVFQSYALYPHMTVEQNMGFSLKIAGRPRAEIADKVAGAADILGLQPLLKRKPAQLSGGQRQRVAMGRAIVRDPAVFLFDEPLSNLDAQLRVQMRAEIKALHQRLKTTTVYVTHDQVEAMTMADKIVVMSAGNVEQMGRPLDLFDRPDNLFVARFIGSPQMNLIKGVVERVGNDTVFNAGNWSLPLGQQQSESQGKTLTLGFRPDQVSVAQPHEPAAIDTRVTLVEPTGTETMVTLDLHGQSVMAVFRERIESQPGQTLRVSINPGQLHLFDTQTGRRLN